MEKPKRNFDSSLFKICCVGEPMIELSDLSGDVGVPFFNVAGDTLNTAVYLKRILGKYADIFYLTVLGKDPLSVRIQDFIVSEDISTDFIRHHPDKNCGIYVIENDSDGERTFHYWRENSAARTLFESDNDFKSLGEADIIYLSGITIAILGKRQRDRLMKWLGTEGQKKTILFDSNFRKNLWSNLDEARHTLKAAMKEATLCFPSKEDLNSIFASMENLEFLQEYCKTPNEFFVVKKGGNQSPQIISGKENSLRLEGFKKIDKVSDSTGAGDSFNAGFIGAYLMGEKLSKSLQYGHELASKILKHKGAICSAEEIVEFNFK